MHAELVVLVGRSYWQGLLDWVRGNTRERGYIAPEDLDIIKVTDEPAEAVAHVCERLHAVAQRAAERQR